ncbi:MAG: ribonuclease HII, partial [Oscillospiraceae bacterium]
IEKAESYCIATASVSEIAEMNILNAAMLAMKRAFEGLDFKPRLALVDGNRKPDLDCETVTVVKGDAKSASVAAASILAKVSRDRYMKQMAQLYPQYGFDKHAGYGTKAHIEALRQFGPCPIHRELFLRKILSK